MEPRLRGSQPTDARTLGDNTMGQLGNGSTRSATTPVAVAGDVRVLECWWGVYVRRRNRRYSVLLGARGSVRRATDRRTVWSGRVSARVRLDADSCGGGWAQLPRR